MAEKIMVVDDEPDLEALVRQKFRKQIKSGEWDFVFAYNGLEALAKLIENPGIAIILSDINMPEMDGLTLLTKLHELKNPALKTIIVSAYGDMTNIRTAMNRGAFDFVTKPVDFNDLETTVKKTIEQLSILRQAQKEHDKLVSIEHDLSVARDIQLSILPKVFPPFPHRKEIDICAKMEAAKEIGGDFYDFFFIDDERFGVVIGDVSGKGIPAALFMAVSRTLIKATALKGMPPIDCLNFVNKLLCNESVSSMFVTVFYGILNVKTGELTYTCAGHNPPYLISSKGEVSPLDNASGMMLGILDEIMLGSKTTVINPGDGLFLYTDGVTEAFNAGGDMYLEEKLEAKLKEIYADSFDTLVDVVMADVRSFAAGFKQSDDITALFLKYNGTSKT
ncbi:MAG: SpoIIE family protein phosphatase [Ignavibacteriae bacterium]|jgi:sigma-B regulation protein RsbU (phosphoserine phosphatase)|nr:SpoIIE family protein phosphatase [Ignavibacteriota bacterium]